MIYKVWSAKLAIYYGIAYPTVEAATENAIKRSADPFFHEYAFFVDKLANDSDTRGGITEFVCYRGKAFSQAQWYAYNPLTSCASDCKICNQGETRRE